MFNLPGELPLNPRVAAIVRDVIERHTPGFDATFFGAIEGPANAVVISWQAERTYRARTWRLTIDRSGPLPRLVAETVRPRPGRLAPDPPGFPVLMDLP